MRTKEMKAIEGISSSNQQIIEMLSNKFDRLNDWSSIKQLKKVITEAAVCCVIYGVDDYYEGLLLLTKIKKAYKKDWKKHLGNRKTK